MLSLYRTPSSSIVQTRKLKTPNDIKVTSNDIKTISNDLETTSKKSVEYEKNKLKGGDPINNQNNGRDLTEQTFSFI